MIKKNEHRICIVILSVLTILLSFSCVYQIEQVDFDIDYKGDEISCIGYIGARGGIAYIQRAVSPQYSSIGITPIDDAIVFIEHSDGEKIKMISHDTITYYTENGLRLVVGEKYRITVESDYYDHIFSDYIEIKPDVDIDSVSLKSYHEQPYNKETFENSSRSEITNTIYSTIKLHFASNKQRYYHEQDIRFKDGAGYINTPLIDENKSFVSPLFNAERFYDNRGINYFDFSYWNYASIMRDTILYSTIDSVTLDIMWLEVEEMDFWNSIKEYQLFADDAYYLTKDLTPSNISNNLGYVHSYQFTSVTIPFVNDSIQMYSEIEKLNNTY